jgi:hypothetical protein
MCIYTTYPEMPEICTAAAWAEASFIHANVCVYICVCFGVYVCMYVCEWLRMCVYEYERVCMLRTCECVYECNVCMYACIHACMCASMCTYVSKLTRSHTPWHTHQLRQCSFAQMLVPKKPHCLRPWMKRHPHQQPTPHRNPLHLERIPLPCSWMSVSVRLCMEKGAFWIPAYVWWWAKHEA